MWSDLCPTLQFQAATNGIRWRATEYQSLLGLFYVPMMWLYPALYKGFSQVSVQNLQHICKIMVGPVGLEPTTNGL